jgi:hypothetical protein
MTAPAERVPYTPNQTAGVVFTLAVVLLMLCVPASRGWLMDQGRNTVLWIFDLLGADTGPLTWGVQP